GEPDHRVVRCSHGSRPERHDHGRPRSPASGLVNTGEKRWIYTTWHPQNSTPSVIGRYHSGELPAFNNRKTSADRSTPSVPNRTLIPARAPTASGSDPSCRRTRQERLGPTRTS